MKNTSFSATHLPMHIAHVLLAAALLLHATPSRAEPWPLTELGANASGTTSLGTWSLAAVGPRSAFPGLTETNALRGAGGDRWELPASAAGFLAVNAAANRIGLRVSGEQNKPELDRWAPAILFAPTEGGTFTLAGKLTGVWFDGNKADPEAAQWAVVVLRPGAATKVVAGGRIGDGASVDFGAVPKLRSVALAAGERLVLMVWRPHPWHAVGGNLVGLDISRGSADG